LILANDHSCKYLNHVWEKPLLFNCSQFKKPLNPKHLL